MDAWRKANPEDAIERDIARVAARIRAGHKRNEKKLAISVREEMERRIVSLVMLGLTTEEIADEIGKTTRVVQRICKRIGFDRLPSGYRRIPAGRMKARVHTELVAIANTLRLSPAQTVERLVTFTLEGGGIRARQILGIGRRIQ